jgi:hypothetical protein
MASSHLDAVIARHLWIFNSPQTNDFEENLEEPERLKSTKMREVGALITE